MDENALHPQRIGHHASVLARGSAEAAQRVLRDVVPALHGNVLDRVCHVFDGDLEESVGHLFG